jgi:hypothetical protein
MNSITITANKEASYSLIRITDYYEKICEELFYGDGTLFYDEDKDPYNDMKHTVLDKYAMLWERIDVAEIVNKYGVLEALDDIECEYGEEELIYIMRKNKVMKYRTIFYHILMRCVAETEDELINLLTEDEDDEAD